MFKTSIRSNDEEIDNNNDIPFVLNNLKRKKASGQLEKEIAKRSDIYVKSKSKRSEIIDKIIEGTVAQVLKIKY